MLWAVVVKLMRDEKRIGRFMATVAKLPFEDSLGGYSLYGEFIDEDSMNI